MNNIKSIIENWDPIDLLSHAPDDEYNSEIEDIQRLLLVTTNCDELTEGIIHIFEKSFGKENFNKSKDECRQIARIILKETT